MAWCRRSAERGDEFGQYLFGALYFSGHGVERDLVEAYKWFLLSQDRARQPSMRYLAADGLRKTEEYLSPEQIEEAKNRAKARQPTVP